MTRHLNLLDALPRAAPRAAGLSAWAVPALAALLVLAGAAAFGWTRHTTESLEAQLQAARRTATASGATTVAVRLDATVLQGLRETVLRQEAQAALLGGAGSAAPGEATPSRWLAALDETGAAGLALNSVRIEPGARLTLEGSARQASDVNALLARLQGHPVTSRAAIDRLELRRGESDGAPLKFRLTPPAPDGAAASAPAAEGRRAGP